MPHCIRKVKSNDLNELLHMYLSLHEDSVPENSEQLLNLWHEILSDKNYHILVYELDGKIVASCTVVIIKNLTRGQRSYALIENVVTLEQFRGQGFATALLNEAVNIAKSAGCYKMMLLTGSKEETTLHFYEKAGFNRKDKTAFIRWLK